MRELVFKIKWGGLGDHLFYSPIPRIAKQTKQFDRVFISNHSDYKDLQTKELVWRMNPFVDGFSDEDGPYPQFGVVEEGMNLLDKIMLFCGVDDGKRFHEPEIYYKPKIIHELKNVVLFDPNFGTNVGHPGGEVVENFFERNNIQITHQMKLMSGSHSISCDNFLSAKSLEHFCDILNSCKKIFCFTTGTATLAAAIGKSMTVLFVDGVLPMFHHSKLHVYRNLT